MKSFIITYEMSVLIDADSMEDAQKKFDNTNIQEEFNPEFVRQTSIKLINEKKNMETFNLEAGDKVLHKGIVRTIFDVYSDTHVSLCFMDEDGDEYEDVKGDYQIPISELTKL